MPHIDSVAAASATATSLGLGVGLIAMPHALPHLHSGKLMQLLPGWYSDAGSISLYYAAQKLLPAKTPAFVDFLVTAFRVLDIAGKLRADRCYNE